MRKYKWGILAPGSIAVSFTKGLEAIPEAERWAVGSRDIGRARAFADKHGYEKAYGSYAELAADPDVEIIYVATPHPQHEEATITCLNAGKAVICEKPFAANAQQAERMIGCAAKNKAFLMEAMWTRFLPAVRKARELVEGGAIGPVRHIFADFAFRAQRDPGSRLFAPASAGGSLLDVGVYNVSLCSFFYGYRERPSRVQSHLDIGPTGVDETASVALNYVGGRSALLYSAIRVNTSQEAVIYGEDGYIRIPNYWHGDTLIIKDGGGERVVKLPFEATGYQFEALEVMECLENGLSESPMLPLAETLAVMETLDQIRFANHLRYPFECAAKED